MTYYLRIDVDQRTGWSNVEPDGRMPFLLADEIKRTVSTWAETHKDK